MVERMPGSLHGLAENLKFFGQFLRSPRMIGSVMPTSPRVIDDLLSTVAWDKAGLFVEYGPGMGTFTRPILARLRPDAKLVAIDTCKSFIDHLSRSIDDPRLELVHGSAADVETILRDRADGKPADYVLSGLPFSMLPDGVGQAIASATSRVLAPGGALLVYQYSGLFVPILRPYFNAITLRRIWRNIPPCMVSVARR